MREKRRIQNDDNLINDFLAGAFGFDDKSLVREFDRIAAEPDSLELISPPGEFGLILEQLKEGRRNSKVVRLKRVIKAGILVAALGGVLLGTGIGASGKRAFESWIRKPGDTSIWNNTDNLMVDYGMNNVYQNIEEGLGIEALELHYLPVGMELTDVLIDSGYARLNFTYNGNLVIFMQSQNNVELSGNTATDCVDVATVDNKRLKLELPVYKNTLKGGEIELSTEFVINKTYYYIAGIIELDEFEQMLVNISP